VPDDMRSPTTPTKIKEIDFAQIEARALFMAGWDACFAKRDSEGNVPPNADDRADAAFVRNYGVTK
jgi:hypothetical protein